MKHLSFSSQRKWLVCSAICQPKSQALLTSWTLGVICTVYEEPLFLPQKCVKIHYEASLLFQLADGLHPQTKLLCRKMKSQKSVIICVVYYLRKIRVLLEMSISTKSRITNVFEQTKTTVYLKEDLDNHCFIIFFFEGIINLTLLIVCHPTPLR